MPWWAGLSPETIRELRDRHPTLSLEEVAIAAIRSPSYGEEFARLGAEVMSDPEVDHWGRQRAEYEPIEIAWFPPANATACRDLVVVAMLDTDGPTAAARVGRPLGSEVPIPPDTVLEILRRVVEENASARAIADATDEDPGLSFVNRIKAGVIVKWVAKHPAEARRAVDRQEIPADFPATAAGVMLPNSRTA
jgi:hypothetical protein